MHDKAPPEWEEIPTIYNADGTVTMELPDEFIEHLKREGKIPFAYVSDKDAKENAALRKLK